MPQYLVLYWTGAPDPKKYNIIRETSAGLKYEQVPTCIYVLDLKNAKQFKDKEGLLIGPYSGEKYVYILTEYEHDDPCEMYTILQELRNKHVVHNPDDDIINVVLTNKRITNFGKYSYFADSLWLDNTDESKSFEENYPGKIIIENDDIGGDVKEGIFD